MEKEWYLSTYPDIAASGKDPLTHYLLHGFIEGRQPGPMFDSEWYLSVNADVAAHGTNPVVHFLTAPRSEGRRARTHLVPAPPGCRNIAVEVPRDVATPKRLVVMVHAFYQDAFAAICTKLRNIGFPFTLLVSIPSESDRALTERAIARNGLTDDVVIRVAPNRGRNFGPLFVEFADEVRDGDILLHLHTKKSLYAGAEQASWRDHIVDSLIGTRAISDAIVQLFWQEPRVGIVYPVTVPHLSHWAHHWLKNDHIAPQLFTRLGVDVPPPTGYFEYPVGGMFWARVDAIQPFLAAEFQYEDFPEEMGQTDGTLAHAIERAIVPIIKARGYSFVEFDKSTGAFQLGWGTKNLDHYTSLSFDGLAASIRAAQLVSFDLFDTLITRMSTSPDSVLRLVGVLIEEQFPDAQNFFTKRKEAELAARQAKNWLGDVGIDEIYGCFIRSDGWDEETLAAAKQLELRTELEQCYERPIVAQAARLARDLGKRTILMSDTYLDRSTIERLLDSVGLLDTFDELYLSSSIGARKDRGDLWDTVQEREGVDPESWLHVGDNERSDIQEAVDRRIHTYHTMGPTALLQVRGLDCLQTEPESWGNDIFFGPSVLKFGRDPFIPDERLTPLVVTDPTEMGYGVFGPLVMGFLTWLARHPALGGIEHLYFFSREGLLLRSAWEQLRKKAMEDLPRSTYLAISRRTVITASQGMEWNPERIIEGSGFAGPLGDLLTSRLGLSLVGIPSSLLPWVRLPEDEALVETLLAELRPRIVRQGTEEGHAYRAYLASVGLASDKQVGVVDIGYSATIQRNLQTLIGTGLTGFYMATVAKAAQVQEDGGTAFGCFEHELPGWTPTSEFLLHSLIVEAMLMAPHGQVERVEWSDNSFTTHYRQDHRTEDELHVLRQLQAGVLQYCDELIERYGRALVSLPVDVHRLFQPVSLFARGVIECQSVAPYLVVDDDFCGVPRRHINRPAAL